MKSPLQIQKGGVGLVDLEPVTKLWNSYIKPSFTEQMRLLPDSVLIGSGILALVTQSFATTVFFISLLETAAVGTALRTLFSYMNYSGLLPGTPDPSVCTPNILRPSLETIASFGKGSVSSTFPSFPIFFLSTAASYVIGTMYSEAPELQALGASYAARFYIGIFSSLFLLFVVMTYRLSMGCEGLGVLILTLFAGLLLGPLLVYQNSMLLGRDATNLLGIPLLTQKTKDGKPIYVCPQ